MREFSSLLRGNNKFSDNQKVNLEEQTTQFVESCGNYIIILCWASIY